MKAHKFLKSVCAMSIVSVLAFALVGCSGEGNNDPFKIQGLTGGVAATVNGVEIEEDTITIYIEKLRDSRDLTDDDAWGEWLAEGGFTPESVREEVVNFYVGQELVKQEAEKNDITVDKSEVDGYVDQMRVYYDTDEAWEEALAGSGLTEEEYRSSIEITLLQQKVQDELVGVEEVTDEEVLEAVQPHVSAYDGAKRSSHILFNSEDEAKAQEVLEKVKAGELDFAEAAKEYSQDPGSAQEGGDVGWDKVNSFVPEYTEGLEALEKDQISDLVASDYGFHIIKVTDIFIAPETLTDLSQLPEGLFDLESIKESLQNSKQSEAVSEWYETLKEEAIIENNDMPSNVPYNVDMSKYETEDSETDLDTNEGNKQDAEGNEIDPAANDQAEGNEENQDNQGNDSSEESNSGNNQPTEVATN